MIKNESHFEKLYHEYKTLVFNVALNYLQNPEDAAEITQDVFVKVYHSPENFSKKSQNEQEYPNIATFEHPAIFDGK